MATVVRGHEDRGMSIGRVFQRAFSTMAHNPLAVLAIAAVFGALPSVLMNYVMASFMGYDPASLTGRTNAMWGAITVTWLFSVVIGALVQGALTRAVVADYEGNPVKLGDCFAAAARVVLPLIAVGLLYAVAIGVGTMLLIVPGIIVMIMWAAAGPALVVEREGVGRAFSRSAELSKGFRWKIFGLLLVLLALYFLIFAVLGLVGLSSFSSGDPQQRFSVMGITSSAISAVILNLLWGTIQPALYLELRQAKDGGSLENLEQVFA